MTSTRSSQPRASIASTSTAVRRSLESRSTPRDAGQSAARTSPGIPPADPRAKKRSGEAFDGVWASERKLSTQAASSTLWLTWVDTGPSPRNPRSFARANTSTRGAGIHGAASAVLASGRRGRLGRDHDVPAGLFALGPGDDALHLVDGVVHDLAIRSGHGLKRLLGPFGQDSFDDPLRKALQRSRT